MGSHNAFAKSVHKLNNSKIVKRLAEKIQSIMEAISVETDAEKGIMQGETDTPCAKIHTFRFLLH